MPDYSISFIVIALNEEAMIGRCLDSIFEARSLGDEVIVVDSGSNDNTLNIARKSLDSDNVQLYQLTGERNAAIARNIGISQAQGDYLFFIDGDVEIDKDFVDKAVSFIENDHSEAVLGRLREIQYSKDFTTVIKTLADRYKLGNQGPVSFCGGIFIAKRSAIEATGLFYEKLPRSQDIDFTLRFTKNFRLVYLDELMGTHHTIPYSSSDRMISSLKGANYLYQGNAMTRNLGNLKGVFQVFRRYSEPKFLLIFMSLLLTYLYNPIISLSLFLALLVTDIILAIIKGKTLAYLLVSHYIYPLYIFVGLTTINLLNRSSPKYTVKRIVD